MFRYIGLDGKRHTVYASDLNSLRIKEKSILKDLDDGIIDQKNDTLNHRFDVFMRTKNGLQDTTYDSYCYIYRHYVQQQLGDMLIGNIKKSDLLAFYSSLPFKNRTISYIHSIIYAVLELSVEDDLIRKNPAKGCAAKYSRVEHPREPLTIQQQKDFMDYVQNSEYKRHLPLFVFLLGTGCRIGEALGLTWNDNDIDFKKNIIRIRKQLIYKSFDGKMQYKIHIPKTINGNRNIPMIQSVREQLLKLKSEKMFLSKSSEFEIDGYKNFVFVTGKGKPIQPYSFYLTIQRICRDIRLDGKDMPDISAHIFRHTACTRMAEAGIDIKVLQQIMGHGNLDMIMQVYNHVSDQRMETEMKKIEHVIGL